MHNFFKKTSLKKQNKIFAEMTSNNINPCESLTNDLDRIKKRQKYTKKLINDKVDQVLGFLEETNSKITQITSSDKKNEVNFYKKT